MGGFFGTIAIHECISDLYYGTDYNSHLGTRRGGMAVYDGKNYFRSIHSLENSYFRTKFEPELMQFKGKSGIGVISDTEPQPLLIHSHLANMPSLRCAKLRTRRSWSHRP